MEPVATVVLHQASSTPWDPVLDLFSPLSDRWRCGKWRAGLGLLVLQGAGSETSRAGAMQVGDQAVVPQFFPQVT